jgi:Tfp pilus assembly protein PilF/peroxiredoxin
MSKINRLCVLCLGALLGLAISVPDLSAQQEDQRGALGSKAQEFLLEGPFGATQRFPDRTSGKVDYTVVVFWATWNKPSERELDRLSKLWPKWSKNRVQVIAINVESSRIDPVHVQAIRDWLKQKAIPFPVVLDRGLKAFHAYGVIAIPTTLVVDASGTIVFRLPGYPVAGAEELVEVVEQGVIHTDRVSRGDPSSSAPGFRRAVRYTHLAQQLSAKGEFEMAKFTLQKAIAESPSFLEAKLALAALFQQLDDLQAAETLLAEAAAASPMNSAVLLAHAGLKLRAGEPEAARTFAEAALELDQESGSALTLLAQAYRESGHPESALPYLQKAVGLNPLDFAASHELAKTLHSLGNQTEAILWYERAYQILDPSWNS